MTNSLTSNNSSNSGSGTATTTGGGEGGGKGTAATTTTNRGVTTNWTTAITTTTMAATTFMPVGEILSHKLTMFNFKLPSARTLHESSLIYCNLCDFSCDLTDKSAIIVHYLNKHPEDNIVYSYLWPQMETTTATGNNSNPYKIKYYLIKAHLKVRSKETNGNNSQQTTTTTVVTTTTDLSTLNYPNTILSSEESSSVTTVDEDSGFVVGKLLDWIDSHLTTTTTTSTSGGLGPAAAAAAAAAAASSGETGAAGSDVQELEEEQEVQEVEMSPGEDVYDPSTALVPLLGGGESSSASAATTESAVGDLLKLTASTLYYSNQQKILNNTPGYTLVLDNSFLVHLLAISKIENVFRVKQIHDYYGGCFVCGQKVEFNMKHYQTHFNTEMTAFMCLHCNHKEYRQEAEKSASSSSSSSQSTVSSSGNSTSSSILKSPSHNHHDGTTSTTTTTSNNNNSSEPPNPNDPHSMLSTEERLLQSHMTSQHQIDFGQIVAQHQQLSSSSSSSANGGGGGGATNNGEGVVLIESPPMNDMYLQVTIKSLKYIDDELLKRDEFKADLFYSCPICLGDVSVHVASPPGPLASAFAQHESVTFDYLMAHFYHYHQFKAVPLFVCSLCNCARVSLVDCVYHYIRSHFNSKPVIGICAYNISDKIAPGGTSGSAQSSATTSSSGSKKSASASNQSQVSSTQLLTNSLAMVASTQSHVYGSGPLVHCVICAENYSNEHAFIRHSFLAHLLDPNINLNWFKVYTPTATNQVSATHTYEQSLQYIAQAMSDDTLSETLVYECPLCFKPLNSRDSIARHLIYHALSEQYEYDMQCITCAGGKQLSPVNNLAECLLHVREFRGHRVQIGFHKFVLNGSAENGEQVKPMCSCVLCGYEQSSIFASIHHVMVDHFGYDSSTVRMKRFVNALLGQAGPLSITASSDISTSLTSTVSPVSTTRIKLNSLKAGLPSSATSTPKPSITSSPSSSSSQQKQQQQQDTSQFNAELVAYFGQHFPTLINELLVALMSAATNQQQSGAATAATATGASSTASTGGLINQKIGGVNHQQSATTTTNRSPDTFLQDIRCFKCGKFATKLKNSLFRHLHDEHQFEMKEMERLYEHHIQTQLQLIDEQHLVEKYERGQREVAQQQLLLFKEARVKSEQQRKEAAANALQSSSIVMHIDGQPTLLQLSDASIQPPSTALNSTATASSLTDNTSELIVPVSQQQTFATNNTISTTIPATTTTTVSQQQPSTTTTSATHSPQTVPKTSKSSKHNQHHHQQQQQQQQQQDTSQSSNKIDSVIDQVLSQYCKEDYSAGNEDVSPNKLNSYGAASQQHHHHHHHHHQQQHQQPQQQITVTAQPPEAENLFVFKCNLCESFSTDDATALLDHYKLTHSVELTIADSSTLLAAAVAAFQTGHTIEMTGAILNTLSSVTDESGLTIISGEEVPVHTTVQYKCTLCQAIFYEKQYIVQHLYDAHNFEIDVAYFEEIEQQQQEQLQQKILEQNQEQQLIMQQQQQQQAAQNAAVQSADQLQHIQTEPILLEPEQQQVPAQVQVVTQQQRPDGTISDETAAVMMVMMNGGTLTATPLQPNQIITDASGNATAQLVITQNGDAQLVTASGTTALLQSHQDIQSLIPAASVSQQQKPAINYSCTYCNFGSDKLKKMSDHLKQMHANREKTCMDNTRQQLIRLPNEDLPPYNQPPTTVGALLNLHQQQQMQLQQQQMHQKSQPRYQQAGMDNLSSSLLNLTNSASSSIQQQQQQQQQQQTPPQGSTSVTDATSQQNQQQQQQQQQSSTKSTPGRKRGPKAKATSVSGSGGGRTPTVATTLSKQLQQQQQQQMLRAPTILTMDANSQIIIDFNQNDDLLCGYCDYTMNNLNYMRTHIKYKHKSLPITFQNKITSKYYTIVEWPLTPVPTLTPAPSQPTSQPSSSSSSALGSQQQQNDQQTNESGSTTTTTTTTTENQTTSPSIKSSASKENLAAAKREAREAAAAAAAAAAVAADGDSKAGYTQAGGININTNNVNSILKKLGVNIGQSGGQTALSSLISGIGSGTKSVNNSIVNVNLNSLKDVNLDEMIDDDDDEERKFLIRELEKKAAANAKKGLNTSGTGYNSDTGSTGGGSSGAVRVKRSRSNSSTGGLDTSQGVGDSSPVATTTTPQSTAACGATTTTLAQLNITLNCHYCWAQFQLNVTKNLKNSVQQKENGKYMQHLSLHLNAPYKCNECSYPITDTKTFYKHKQFYKHDEKTCIMVDNDLSLPATSTNQQTAGSSSSSQSVVRRKTLISTRLRQFIQQLQSTTSQDTTTTTTTTMTKKESTTTSNEMELENESDSFKCLLCYPDSEAAPSTSTSTLNKRPTGSTLGASNFSFDKEQVLKHVLIVHLSFLAYKCDTCVQFYAFDEPQTKQHAALVHQSNEVPCQFKLIKTEEEINLAINRAQQFIAKIAASSSSTSGRKREPLSSNVDASESVSSSSTSKRHQAVPSITTPIDAVPKYKCCKCSPLQQPSQQQSQQSTDDTTTTTTTTTTATNSETSSNTSSQQQRPIVLYTYQEALDHVMSTHMSSQLRQQQQQQQQTKGSTTPVAQKQALNYELELFEQQMEDLIAAETGVVTTVAASKAATVSGDDESEESDDEDLGEWASDGEQQSVVDYSEWSFALSEPLHLLQGSGSGSNPSSASPPNQLGHRRKRFKTNANTSLSDLTVSTTTTSQLTRPGQHFRPKRFFYKPYLLIECSICSRRMTELDVDHWLEHEAESHKKLFGVSDSGKFVYQQLRSGPNGGSSSQPSGAAATQADGSAQSSSHVNSKSYESFTQFWADFSVTEKDLIVKVQPDTPQKLQNCLVCGSELKHLYADIIGHYANEHGLAHLTTMFKLWQLECLNAMQSNNLCQLSIGVHIRKHPYIRLPPALVNTQSGSSEIITRAYLIDKEIKCLNEIFKEQVVEKQIVSWLNTEQFFRRWFNYSSYVCVICSASKTSILDSHYSAKCKSDRRALETTRTHFYSDEMKTVVLTNHVLSHFNEYCYRCMSCKISWPDRTQLLKHSQECPNSQVVRTKTKYKLKANHRIQLKFYLLSLIDYWTQERDRSSTTTTTTALTKPNAKCFLKDLKSKRLLLEVASRNGLSVIHTDASNSIRFEDVDANVDHDEN